MILWRFQRQDLLAVGHRRGANFLLLALTANDFDRILAGDLQVMFLAQFKECLKMLAGHGVFPLLGVTKGFIPNHPPDRIGIQCG